MPLESITSAIDCCLRGMAGRQDCSSPAISTWDGNFSSCSSPTEPEWLSEAESRDRTVHVPPHLAPLQVPGSRLAMRQIADVGHHCHASTELMSSVCMPICTVSACHPKRWSYMTLLWQPLTRSQLVALRAVGWGACCSPAVRWHRDCQQLCFMPGSVGFTEACFISCLRWQWNVACTLPQLK